RQERGGHAQGGGLAGAVRAEKGDELTGFDVEVDAAYGFDGLFPLEGESARETAGVDHGGFLRAWRSSPWRGAGSGSGRPQVSARERALGKRETDVHIPL